MRTDKKGQSKKLLFVSCPVGLGHATRDIQIGNIIKRHIEDLHIVYASSGSAARFIQNSGLETIDTKLPESGHYFERICELSRIVRVESPDFVINDEEPVIVPIMKSMDVPVITITDYLPYDNSEELTFFLESDSIVFPDIAMNHPRAERLSEKISFVGPMIRPLNPNARLKKKIRRELGISENSLVILVTAGGRAMESKYLFDTAIKAFTKLPWSHKKLIVIAGPLKVKILNELSLLQPENTTVTDITTDYDKFIAVSDIVITRGGHSTLWETMVLGVPSISVPFSARSNPLNEIFTENMQRFGVTVIIKDSDLTDEKLYSYLTNEMMRVKMKENIALMQSNMNGWTDRGEKTLVFLVKKFLERGSTKENRMKVC